MHRMKFLLGITWGLSVGMLLPLHAGNWPSWRGPAGDNRSDDANAPTNWSASRNVKWRAELPEAGNSSPVVWENRVFVTQAIHDGKERKLYCFDRANGKILW